METFVLCDTVGQGLRDAEATVSVKSIKGRPEFLRVSRSNLLVKGGKNYLAVGVVHVDPDSKAYLIEFPHEADSGASRIWVNGASVVTEQVPV